MKKITDLVRTKVSRSVFRKFADKYELVYFGLVDQNDDEHKLVRGFTMSKDHTDRYYSVGTIAGKDIIILERTDHAVFPGKAKKRYVWQIMEFDLPAQLPHTIIDFSRYDDVFYANLLIKHKELINSSQSFNGNGYDPLFASTVKTLSKLADPAILQRIITPTIANTLTAHYRQFDYEIEDDKLIIYHRSIAPTPLMLESMLKIGLWLHTQLSNQIRSDSSIPRHS